MRDPARIDVVLDHLREAWKANPDLRLTQLLYNAAPVGRMNPALYNLEDDQLVPGLIEMQP